MNDCAFALQYQLRRIPSRGSRRDPRGWYDVQA
jgi:hypothetical protein